MEQVSFSRPAAIPRPSVLLQRALSQLDHGATHTMFCLPAPLAPLERMLDVFPNEEFCLWAPPDGAAVVGIGAAALFVGNGPERLEELEAWYQKVSAELLVHNLAAGAWPSPRLLGGVSFAPGSCECPAWEGFSDASFCLPRWTYLCTKERACLYLAANRGELLSEDGRTRILQEHRMIVAALEAPEVQTETSEEVCEIEQLPFERWREQVEAVRALIKAGAASKIVTARRAHIRSTRARRPAEVLARMRKAKNHCTRFAIRRGNRTFVGLTPETLFRKSGGLIATHALAGTACRGGRAPQGLQSELQLLESGKDNLEHALVAEEIRAKIAVFCSTLVSDERPRLRQVRQLTHLETHFAGSLRDGVHPAQLLAALHPTPAVAGTPSNTALEWIATHEATARGWYAGAIGYIDLAGDSVFSVAIRSGLLAGQDIYAFAGAGIVEGSDAQAEYRETAAKQEPLLWAVGVRTQPVCPNETGAKP